jgi:hypothetical protein
VLNKIDIHRFDGLDAIVFAVPPGNSNLTAVYSFRLAMNLGSKDYLDKLKHAKKPMALIAGSLMTSFTRIAMRRYYSL